MKTFRRFVSRLLLRRAWPRTRGEVDGLPLKANAEVLRDRWGIPHIRAANEHDAFLAQGYVHAQDRLWQMESMRRLSEGRLSEVAGTSTLAIDGFSRAMGMADMKRRASDGLAERDAEAAAAYAAGVNACLERMGRNLPLEFRSMGFRPDPWKPGDIASVLPFLSWWLSAWPYAAKLLAVLRGRDLSLAEWDDMFASHPGARLPADPFFDRLAGLKYGALTPWALAFHGGLQGGRSPEGLGAALAAAAAGPAGSNNWAVRRGADGLPLLANDPHLGASLPAVWYFCHLAVEGGWNAAGTSLPGTPGLVIGRNEKTAWGLTNVMLDVVDLVVYRLDPRDPARHLAAGRWEPLARESMRIGLPKGASVTVPLHRTGVGPAVTEPSPGAEAVAAARWLATEPEGAIRDRTLGAMLSFLRAGSAAEVLEAARGWLFVSQNVVAADAGGHVGWHACGAAPLRRGGSGRFPMDGSNGAGWEGFRAYEEMPHALDPAEGWIATANTHPAGDREDLPLSCYYCPPYRYGRITAALSALREPGVEDFRRLQSDVHSAQADRILPRVLALPLSGAAAREAARLLAAWDREVRRDSGGAAVYEAFLVELNRELLGGVLGDDLPLFYNAKGYGMEDVVFERPGSPLWKRAGAQDEAGRARVVERALEAAMGRLSARMGRDPRRWSWGRMHRHAFRHPGAKGAVASWLLNPDPFPASGDCNTVNANWFFFGADPLHVTTCPSMRMIVPLGDVDGMRIVGPLGQSGHPGHRHYDAWNRLWAENEMIPLPLTRAAVEKLSAESLVLKHCGCG